MNFLETYNGSAYTENLNQRRLVSHQTVGQRQFAPFSLRFLNPEVQDLFNEEQFDKRLLCLRLYTPFLLVMWAVILSSYLDAMPSGRVAFGCLSLITLAAQIIILGYLMATVYRQRVSLHWRRYLTTHCFTMYSVLALLPFSVFMSPLSITWKMCLMASLVAVQVPMMLTFHLNFGFSILSYTLTFCGIGLIAFVGEKRTDFFQLLIWALTLVMGLLITHPLQRASCESFIHYTKCKSDAEGEIEGRAQDLKRIYLSQIMHEIGTPLMVLTLGNDEISDLGSSNPEIVKIVKTNKQAIEMMVRLRERAVDITRHGLGLQLTPTIVKVNIRHLVYKRCSRVMTAFNSNALAKKVKMSYRVDKTVPQYIASDGDFIWDMLCCLLSNAKKYTDEGSIETTVNYDSDTNTIHFQVSDTGIGIEQENQDKLFQPFSQFHTGKGGTGLGLFSVKIKAEALGGKVGYIDRSQNGTGSIFWFSVKCVGVEDCAAACSSPLKIFSRQPSDSSVNYFNSDFKDSCFSGSSNELAVVRRNTLGASPKRKSSADDTLWGAHVQRQLETKENKKKCKKEKSPHKVARVLASVNNHASEVEFPGPSRRGVSWTALDVEATPPRQRSKSSRDHSVSRSRSNSQRLFFKIESNSTARRSSVYLKEKPKLYLYQKEATEACAAAESPDWKQGMLSCRQRNRSYSSQKCRDRKRSNTCDNLNYATASSVSFLFENRSRKEETPHGSSPRWFGSTIEPLISPSHQLTSLEETSAQGESTTTCTFEAFPVLSPKSHSNQLTPPKLKKWSSSPSGLVEKQKSPLIKAFHESERERGVQEMKGSSPNVQFGTPDSSCSEEMPKTIIPPPMTEVQRFSSIASQDNCKNLKRKSFFKIAETVEPVNQTILLIEDEQIIMRMMSRMLSKNGFQVDQAENGAVGLQKLIQSNYCCVFSDLTMPVMDGFEMLQKFREWESSHRANNCNRQYVCALSANSDDVSKARASACGFDNFLSKPIPLKIVLAEIERAKSGSKNII